MIKKMKEYFKGKNPYLMASAAIVITSVIIICLILKDEMSAGQEIGTTTVSTQQSNEAIVEDVADSLQESKATEIYEAVGEIQESEVFEQELEPTEKLVLENAESSEVPESELASIVDTQAKLENQVHSTPTPENRPTPVITPTLEAVTEPEETETSENVSVIQPEPSVPQEPEIETPEESPESEEASAPEVKHEPEITPSPEVTPEPHAHSWIFESWYQEPTCSNGGLVNEICAHCGETQTTPGTPTGKHIYEVETVGDCCTAEVLICKECNHREVEQTNPNNHIDVEDGFCYGCGQKTG